MKQSQSQSRNSQTQSQNQSAPGEEIANETLPPSEGSATSDRQAPPTQPKDAYHDVGSGEEETADGLDPETEFVRQAAEEGALDAPESDDVPVFDRANRSERM